MPQSLCRGSSADTSLSSKNFLWRTGWLGSVVRTVRRRNSEALANLLVGSNSSRPHDTTNTDSGGDNPWIYWISHYPFERIKHACQERSPSLDVWYFQIGGNQHKLGNLSDFSWSRPERALAHSVTFFLRRKLEIGTGWRWSRLTYYLLAHIECANLTAA